MGGREAERRRWNVSEIGRKRTGLEVEMEGSQLDGGVGTILNERLAYEGFGEVAVPPPSRAVRTTSTIVLH